MSTYNPTPFRLARRGLMVRLEEDCGELGWMPRAVVSAATWDVIGGALIGELARRRDKAGARKLGRFPAALSRHEGKEMLLLLWVASADENHNQPERLRVVLANWRGLAPEERWWLVTTADATRGSPSYSPDRGWRRALVIALSENGVV